MGVGGRVVHVHASGCPRDIRHTDAVRSLLLQAAMESGRAGINVSGKDIVFKHPFNMIVGGASGSGKTEWVVKFVDAYKSLVEPEINHLLYCYGVYNSNVLTMEMKGVETHFGLPSERIIRERQKPLLLILDDLMMEAKSEFMDLLFTRGSHHWGVSIIFITQNLFEKSLKTARNNAHYIVLLRNPSGQLQIRNLGTQLFPRNLAYFMESYKDATRSNFGYLLIDMHPSSSDLVRLRTYVFAEHPVVYTPKNA
jgi:hypothetical protein